MKVRESVLIPTARVMAFMRTCGCKPSKEFDVALYEHAGIWCGGEWNGHLYAIAKYIYEEIGGEGYTVSELMCVLSGMCSRYYECEEEESGK